MAVPYLMDAIRADARGVVRMSARGIPAPPFLEMHFARRGAAWEAAAADGVPEACFLMGRCHEYGVGVARAPERALAFYAEAAEAGHPYGQFALGHCYLDGVGTDPDAETGAALYLQAAEQGLCIAACNVALCFQAGVGVERDPEAAVRWLEAAARKGNAVAACNLGICYEVGEGVEPDIDAAVRWYRDAAAQGNAHACFCLGCCYQEGEGVTRDPAEAVRWFRQGAERDGAAAQFMLAMALRDGEGVDRDPVRAAAWLRRAAEQGDADAQHQLALCHLSGEGVSRDPQGAQRWFLRAAEQGHAEATCCVGMAYACGEGVDVDLDEATRWLHRAVELGSVEAAAALESLHGGDASALLPPGEAVVALLEALTDPEMGCGEWHIAASALLDSLTHADIDARDRALDGLLPGLALPDLDRAGFAALVAGAVVECDANPQRVLQPLLTRLLECIDAARPYTEALVAGEAAATGLDAYESIDLFCRPAVAMLSRSVAGRRAARGRAELVAAVEHFAAHHGGVEHVRRLLSALDDETLLVLHPEQRRGFRVRVSGVVENLQLQVLLAARLIGDTDEGYMAGERPAEAAVATARGEGPRRTDDEIEAAWDLHAWTALATGEPRADQLAHRVWHEGAPDEIPAFEGLRTLVLTPPTTLRTWSNARRFEAMEAHVELEALLGEAEVDALVARMRAG